MVDDAQLGDFLLTAGLVSRRQLEGVLGQTGKTLSQTLVEQGMVGADDVRRARAHTLGVPFVVLGREDISLDALSAIPEPVSRAHNIVAYRAGAGELEVALLDIADLGAIDFLKSTHTVRPRLTTESSIKQALLMYQKHLKEKFAGMAQVGIEAADSLLRHAFYSGASHIHIEPALAGTLVRYRIRGVLHEAMRLPEDAGAAIIEKIKSLAKLFHVATAAQEGRFKIMHPYSAPAAEGAGEETIAVSVSTVPLASGEKMLLRLARERTGQKGFSLELLGFHGEPLERLHEQLARRSGLLLVCGPAGSGKTTTLYTLLDFLNEPGVAIATIETKVESRLPHIAQTSTRPEVGLTTLVGLRAVLRHDPDVVMVGDIETEDVLALARSAAQRGVFVLAGTQDPALTLNADTTICVELMQKLCPQCKQPYAPARAQLTVLEDSGVDFGRVLAVLKEEDIVDKKIAWKDVTFWRAVGCEQCESGYKGMIGVQEVACKEYQGPPLLEDALFKAAQGLVSVEALLLMPQV